MADLDPAHVEAVARAQLSSPWPKGSLGEWATNERAERLLTSTDPDVHAALLAALVRAGVLREERRNVAVVGQWQTVTDKKGRTMRQAAERIDRRYVTEWEAL